MLNPCSLGFTFEKDFTFVVKRQLEACLPINYHKLRCSDLIGSTTYETSGFLIKLKMALPGTRIQLSAV
jgi:hypothetical protein